VSRSACADCGEPAVWELTSIREQAAVPADTTSMLVCAAHRLDGTEHVLSQYGNVTITEVLG
jgi:hypothetical protein